MKHYTRKDLRRKDFDYAIGWDPDLGENEIIIPKGSEIVWDEDQELWAYESKAAPNISHWYIRNEDISSVIEWLDGVTNYTMLLSNKSNPTWEVIEKEVRKAASEMARDSDVHMSPMMLLSIVGEEFGEACQIMNWSNGSEFLYDKKEFTQELIDMVSVIMRWLSLHGSL